MSKLVGSDRGLLETSQVQARVDVYDKVVAAVYESKVKKDKLQRAIDDNKWRYDTLPELVAKRKTGEGISKDELARLVQWKLTHGVYRPTLPALIQKNPSQEVLDVTGAARELLADLASPSNAGPYPIVKKALDYVCKLQGVGPATGTLILSVFAPDQIPFFEDELFAWLFTGHDGKLKYNVTEYRDLFEETARVCKKVSVQPWELEKAAYVFKHPGVLKQSSSASTTVSAEPTTKTATKRKSPAVETTAKDVVEKPEKKDTKPKSKDLAHKAGESTSDLRRSKRAKR